MRSVKMKKALVAIVTAAMLVCMLPLSAFADEPMKVTLARSSASSVVQGDSIYIEVSATANAELPYEIQMVPADKEIQVLTGQSGTITSTQKQSVSFKLMATEGAATGFHTVYIKAVKPGEETTVYGQISFSLNVVDDNKGYASMNSFSSKISYDVDGSDSLLAGQTNNLKLFFFNDGNTYTFDSYCTITLPSGMSLKKGTLKQNLGYYLTGKTSTADYQIVVDSDIEDGSYPITIKVAGSSASFGDGSSMTEKSVTETFYIPVTGGKKSSSSENYDYSISYELAEGSELVAGKSNELTIKIKNEGNVTYKNLTSIITLPSGMTLRSGSTRLLLGNLAAGGTCEAKYVVNVDTDAYNGSYAISLLISGIGSSAVTEYIYLPITGGKIEGETISTDKINPILLLSAYDYGGTEVTAGSEFDLSVTLTNTSRTTIQNVKVTVNSEANAFLPVGSSSSYYIASVPAGGSSTKVLHMSCSNDAAQQATSVTVSSSYQDAEGTSYTASDTVTVPVVQQNRLVIDEILDPGWLTADSQGYLSVNYYNMGRNQLYNLRISAEGDFSVEGSASTFVGNMASGRSDYYSLSFWPNGEGPMNGKVIFSFEDAAGNEQVIEKEFCFNIQAGYSYEEDPGMYDDPGMYEEEAKLPVWAWAAIGAGALVILIIIVKAIKKKKRAKREALEIND